jgi:hypothetical protein
MLWFLPHVKPVQAAAGAEVQDYLAWLDRGMAVRASCE